MIGDSWGVPNYSSDWKNCSYEVHTEHQLVKKGYKVFNYSLNGGSMLETIEYAIHSIQNKKMPIFLEGAIKEKRNTYNKGEGIKEMPVPDYRGQKIDWIVWFHTEAVRDQTYPQLNPYLTLEELHTLGSTVAYRAFKKLVGLLPGVKTAVIGGQAPIDKLFFKHHKPTFAIEDWRSEIVGNKLPRVYTLANIDLLDSCYTDKDTKIQLMKDHQTVFDAMMNTDLFFDRCHPGIPHIALAERLHQAFQTL